jgi:probable HAF family extracellular repeat protein
VAVLGASFTVLGTSLSASAASLYSITQISAPGIDTFEAVKITDNGQVLVSGSTALAPNPQLPYSPPKKASAFVWQGGQTKFLEFPVDSDSLDLPQNYDLKDINEAGTVIGYIDLYDVKSEGVNYYGTYGFAWNGGKIDLSGGPSYFDFGSFSKLNKNGQFLTQYDEEYGLNLYLGGEKGGIGGIRQQIPPPNRFYGTTIGYSPSGYLNNLGQVAVTYTGDLIESSSFFWDRGNITPIGTLADNQSNRNNTRIRGINDAAQVIGSSQTANDETHAFAWKAGFMEDLGTLGGTFSEASDINEKGQITGNSTTANGESHSFIYNDGIMTDLEDLGGGSSSALQINADGQIFGCSTTASGGSNAFIWTSGAMRDTGISNCSDSSNYEYIFNDKGQLLVNDGSSSFYYDGDRTFSAQDIETLLGENSGWDISKITGLNNKGQIIGTGLLNGKESAFVMTPNGEPVPEPTTILGSLLAIGSLASRTYRNRKKK